MKIRNIVIGALLMMFSACSLEEKPIDFIGKGNFYQNDADMIVSINGAYDSMRSLGYYGKNFTVCTWCSTDFGVGTGGPNTADQFTMANLSPAHLWLNDIWSSIYDAINRANKTIFYAKDNENLTPDLKNRILGEAHFLRALHYFNLVRSFGAVPMRLEPASADNMDLPISTVPQIYEQIISDLKFAEENCWNYCETRGKYTNEQGRATQLAAKTLLAKVYLHIASSGRVANTTGFTDDNITGINTEYAEFTNWKEYYNLCSKKCSEALAHPDFYMESDWANLWNNENRNSKEFIFSVQSSTVPGYGSQLPFLYLPKQDVLGGSTTSNGSNFRILTAFTETQILYQDNDYRLHKGCSMTIDFKDGKPSEFWRIDAKGKAMYMLVSNPSKKGTGGGKFNQLCITKYRDPASTDILSSACNIPILRSADLYLMKAEADAEYTEDVMQAVDNLNKARTRLAGASEIDLSYFDQFKKTDAISNFREFIMRERLQEFLGETDRWFTLKRMGKLIEKSNIVGAKFPKKLRKNADCYNWPIVLDELESNHALKELQ